MRFHINPLKGEAGRCQARQRGCPFGAATEHYDSLQEARTAFEASMETFSAPLTKKARKPKMVSVFRAGAPVAPETYFADLERMLTLMDEEAPEGRQGRRGAIFASPDLASHGRWLRGTKSTESFELKVDANSTYIYPVDIYEEASSYEYQKNEEAARASARDFWDAGMLLSDWLEWSKGRNIERGSWEILIKKDAISSVRPMTNRRVIENSHENDASQLNFKLEPRRAVRGLIWSKEASKES